MESKIRALFTSFDFCILSDVIFFIFFSVLFSLPSCLLTSFCLISHCVLFCSHRDVSDAAGPPWPSWLRAPPRWAAWLWGAATTPTTTWNASSWTSSNGHAPPRASVWLSYGSPRSYASAWYAWTSSTDASSWIHWPSTTSTLRLPAGAPPSTQTHSPTSSAPSRPTSRPSASVISHCFSSCCSLPISIHFLGPIRVAIAPRG
uniref:Uncharacterized protein n=1 Tax=Capra hircus TaxID=9925 RepID=A0A8C2NGP0_CAPHI